MGSHDINGPQWTNIFVRLKCPAQIPVRDDSQQPAILTDDESSAQSVLCHSDYHSAERVCWLHPRHVSVNVHHVRHPQP
jgi:hypothetical protein